MLEINDNMFASPLSFEQRPPYLRWYHTLQEDNSLKSVERFDHMIFVCRFQASQ
jgi:hypothetical protein